MSKIKILYVEDDKNTRTFMELFLKNVTSELYISADGLDGLDKYKKYHPDIVISDISMPNMDGLTMARNIKKINKHQKIILVSAHGKDDEFLDFSDLENIEILSKPIDIELLQKKIESFF